ncbi:acyltransferase family protein [Nocardioides sp. NPDC006273]|uniref:acyltransferase family protein n=1 Tax=Nocardioides sp. NPDC006273 TaxID=3155598 RepID=UPI0033B519FE
MTVVAPQPVAQASKSGTKSSFRPDLQGLRAIAIGTVLVYHLFPAGWFGGGYIGVDVFFVISGFLITSHLVSTSRKAGGRISLIDFYGRRARRLMPAAILVLTVTWLVSKLVLPTTRLADTAEQVRASTLYFQNWILAGNAVDYLKSDNAPSPVQHFWSLSVEEQFYVVWPLLFLLAWAVASVLRRSAETSERGLFANRVMLGLAAVVVAASLWWSIVETKADPAAAYFVTTTRMWELAAGGLLALLPAAASKRLGALGPLSWIGLGAILASAVMISDSAAFPGAIAIVPVAGAVLMIACGAGNASTNKLMSTRPMVFLGDISYSLYLWHWPVIVLWKTWTVDEIGWVDGPAIAAVSIILAWLTKQFVEDPFRKSAFFSKSRWRSLATLLLAIIPVALVSTWSAPAVGSASDKAGTRDYPGAAVLADPAVRVPHIEAIPDPAAAAEDWPDLGGTCQTPIMESRVQACWFGEKENPRKTIAFVGDSKTTQFFWSVRNWAEKKDYAIVVLRHSICAWGSTMADIPGDDGPYVSCHRWGVKALDQIINDIKPDVVITTARPTLGTPDHRALDRVSWKAIGDGMADYWRKLIAHDIAVVGIKETPEMGTDIPDCLSKPGAKPSDCDRKRSKAIGSGMPVEVAAKQVPRATFIDLNDQLCGPKWCKPVVGNIVVYIDSHHITKTYGLTAGERLVDELKKQPALKE